MQFDVLIITALFDELAEVLALTDGSDSPWHDEKDSAGFRFHYRQFSTDNGEPLHIAAAWSGAMGEVAAAERSRALIGYLQPLCVAMSGICAGRRGDVFLGDVIVANRVFSYDHGKLIASTGPAGERVEQLLHDIETYNLEKTWAMDAAYFSSREIWCKTLQSNRPLSLDFQRKWVLHTLFDHEAEGKPSPVSHPDRKKLCPRWPEVIGSLQKRGLISILGGTMRMSNEGKESVLNDRLLHPDGLLTDPSFRVHVGPIGTGKTVRKDPDIFQRLAKLERNVIGLEMEGAAIGYVAENVGIPAIIVKGVTDYGDEEKDDSFRTFASSASATFLLAFLKQHPPKSLQKTRPLFPSASTKDLSEHIAASVLDSLMKKGVTLALPPEGDLNRSLFYCVTGSGGRVLGVALNNTGLVAYPASDHLTEAISINGDVRFAVTRQIEGNKLINFAIVDSPTHGLPSSYWDQWDEHRHKEFGKFVWTAFDHDGNPIKLALAVIGLTMFRVDFGEGHINLENVISATAKVGSDTKLLRGPVITERNELVGLAVGQYKVRSIESDQEWRTEVLIWPWASLEKCLSEAKIIEQPN